MSEDGKEWARALFGWLGLWFIGTAVLPIPADALAGIGVSLAGLPDFLFSVAWLAIFTWLALHWARGGARRLLARHHGGEDSIDAWNLPLLPTPRDERMVAALGVVPTLVAQFLLWLPEWLHGPELGIGWLLILVGIPALLIALYVRRVRQPLLTLTPSAFKLRNALGVQTVYLRHEVEAVEHDPDGTVWLKTTRGRKRVGQHPAGMLPRQLVDYRGVADPQSLKVDPELEELRSRRQPARDESKMDR